MSPKAERLLQPEELKIPYDDPRLFIGRDPELVVLKTRIYCPDSNLVLVRGMRGMGKSWLLAKATKELQAEKIDAHLTVLRGPEDCVEALKTLGLYKFPVVDNQLRGPITELEKRVNQQLRQYLERETIDAVVYADGRNQNPFYGQVRSNTTLINLSPFTDEETRQQIQAISGQESDQDKLQNLLEATGGHPLANRIVQRYGASALPQVLGYILGEGQGETDLKDALLFLYLSEGKYPQDDYHWIRNIDSLRKAGVLRFEPGQGEILVPPIGNIVGAVQSHPSNSDYYDRVPGKVQIF